MTRRYFVEEHITTPQVQLTGPEAHHAQHVMRAAVGERITVFDGSGREFLARIDAIQRATVQLTILETQAINREAPRHIVLGVTLPKGDRQRWLIEKLTELGVAEVVPLRSARSGVHPAPKALQKLERFVVEASKQCGRNQLMRIGPLTEFQAYLAEAPPTALKLFADPAGTGAGPLAAAPGQVFLAIGPEGGFSPSEQTAAEDAGWRSVALGPRILRIETACLVLAALLATDGNSTAPPSEAV